MSDPSFVVDALAFRDHGEDPSRATRPGEDVLTTLRRILPAEGLSTALRSFEPGQAQDLPLDTVVELRDGSVGIVAGRDARTMRLSTKDGAVELRDADLGERLSGRALVSYRTPGGSPARALLAMVRGDRGLRAAVRDALALSVMQRLLLLVLPFLSRLALGRALPDGERATLTAVVLAVALAGGLVALTSRLRDRALRFVEGHLCERFAREVFRAMLDQPFTAMATRRPGAAWEDFAAADRWVRLTVPQLGALVDGLFGVAFLAALATIAPAAALATSAVALVALAVVAGVGSRQVRGQRTMAQARRGRHELLLQSIDALEVIRAEGLEPSVRRELEALLHREERAALEVGGHNAATAGITSLFERGSFVVVYALLGWQCLAGTASLADLVACVQLVAAFELGFRGVLAAPQRFVVLRTLRAQLRDTLDAMAVQASASPSTDSAPVVAADGVAIAVDDVWFRHEGGPWILRDFRLQVRRGEHITLRWPSGSGKTTLLRLLAGSTCHRVARSSSTRCSTCPRARRSSGAPCSTTSVCSRAVPRASASSRRRA